MKKESDDDDNDEEVDEKMVRELGESVLLQLI